MPRASAGSSVAWLSVTMRLIVRSQFSGVARRYEMRDIRPWSSLRWHDPHFARTKSLRTGRPSFFATSGAAGVCACAGSAAHRNARPASQPGTRFFRIGLRSLMKNSFGDQQGQP